MWQQLCDYCNIISALRHAWMTPNNDLGMVFSGKSLHKAFVHILTLNAWFTPAKNFNWKPFYSKNEWEPLDRHNTDEEIQRPETLDSVEECGDHDIIAQTIIDQERRRAWVWEYCDQTHQEEQTQEMLQEEKESKIDSSSWRLSFVHFVMQRHLFTS